MDLIDRKAAIDVLNKIFPVDPTRNDYTQGITVGAALATEYIKQLPSAQPEQRWIPVTARCPEIGQIVLCLLKTRHYYGRIHVCKYCAADKYYDHPYFDWGHNGFPDVVAWMPLPEPYKEEEAQDED